MCNHQLPAVTVSDQRGNMQVIISENGKMLKKMCYNIPKINISKNV